MGFYGDKVKEAFIKGYKLGFQAGLDRALKEIKSFDIDKCTLDLDVPDDDLGEGKEDGPGSGIDGL